MQVNESVRRDYAGDDPRSVRAWLEGRDDGRGRQYEAFRAQLLRMEPHVPEEEMGLRYQVALQHGWRFRPKKRQAWIAAGCSLYACLVIFYWVAYC